MSAFKQSMRKLGARAGLLAGASAAVLAIAGVSAGSAMAGPTCPNALEFHGKGSSLQKIAQLEVWNPDFNTACSNAPKVTYESTGSAAGLEAFAFTGATPAINHGFQYVGSDDAPNPGQLTTAEGVAGTKPIIVPVSQTAIAVVADLPAGCTFKSGKGINWTELNKVFGGKTFTNWNQLQTEGTCNQAIKRVVRADGSGTTFQFKNYLQVLHESKGAEKLPCEVELPGGTKVSEWSQIEENGSAAVGGKPNTSWPCTVAEGGTQIITAEGGGGVATTVKNTEGTIGYAALPDAKNNGATPVKLQNGEVSGSPTYIEPEETIEKTARCENARYTILPEGRTTGSGEGADWSTVFGAQPNIGGTEYPLCTLTYDIGWNNYTSAGYGANATAWGKDVGSYIRYLVNPSEGQENLLLAEKWYSLMPETINPETNVQGAAEHAASKLPS